LATQFRTKRLPKHAFGDLGKCGVTPKKLAGGWLNRNQKQGSIGAGGL